MSDTTERTYTAADMRAAYMAGQACDHTTGAARAEALRRWPDPEPPEPERRWVRVGSGQEYSVEDGCLLRRSSTPPHDKDVIWTLDDISALASLLPRVPVTVTEEMVEKAMRAYWDRGHHGVTEAIRAALSAVASDLAQPVHACQHTAQWWGVVSDRQEAGFHLVTRDFAQAVEHCGLLNQKAQSWRVIPLAEVDHV
jgi:hypothetical protein